MATITVQVSEDDLASLRDLIATATDPRGSGPGGRYATVEEFAADLLAYLADDWRLAWEQERRQMMGPVH